MNKLYILIFIFIYACVSCNNSRQTFEQGLDDIRNKLAQSSAEEEALAFAWILKLDSLHNIANSDINIAIDAAQQLILKDNSLSINQRNQLYYFLGDVYLKQNNIALAFESFTKAASSENETTSFALAKRAAIYMLNNENDSAFLDLKNAANYNNQFQLDVGFSMKQLVKKIAQ